MDSQTHKAHRPSQSGAKAEKKKSAKGKGKEKTANTEDNEVGDKVCFVFLLHFIMSSTIILALNL